MPEKKIIVRAWYETGKPDNRRILADFVCKDAVMLRTGVMTTAENAFGVDVNRFIFYRDIEKIWEE